MSRYIKLDDAIATIAGQMSYEIEVETGEKTDCLDLAEELLNDIPTIDAVSVVRCKECHFYVSENHECAYVERWVDDDCFCNYGEREGE